MAARIHRPFDVFSSRRKKTSERFALAHCSFLTYVRSKEAGFLGRVLKAGFLFALVMMLRSAEAHSTQVVPATSVWDKLYYFHAQADRAVWDGVYVHPQADRGEVNFFNHCA